MKKTEVKKNLKKLRLARETLRSLTRSDSQQVLGGIGTTVAMSPGTQCYNDSLNEDCGTA
jgi:hypothetical protein